jgi:maltose O-acetyltransferase
MSEHAPISRFYAEWVGARASAALGRYGIGPLLKHTSAVLVQMRSPWPNLGRDVWLNMLCASPLVPNALRWRLYRAYGINAQKSYVCPNVWIGGANLTIGRDTFINYRCVFNTGGGISIGSRCDIAMDVKFVTSTHERGTNRRRAGYAVTKAIIVGDGTWIGAGAILLPGVTIGEGVVIGAGAVVTKDCLPNTVYVGNPARPLSNTTSLSP